MTRIVNLNELVGEDIVFQYGDPAREYRIPGDIPVETVFQLFQMFTTISEIEAERPEDIVVEVRQKFEDISARLLELFQERDPNMRKLPFGIKGIGVVLRTVLGELGVNVDQPDPTPRPSRPVRRKAARTKTKTASRRR